jgi:hypothetical protein
MRYEPEGPAPSLRTSDGSVPASSLADASTAADNPADNTRRGSRRPRATLKRRRPTGAVLELVSEDGDKTLDMTAIHDAVAILLLQYHRKFRSERMT